MPTTRRFASNVNRPQSAAILLTLLAFGLRMFRLGYFSLRGDEAFDALFAQPSLPELRYQLRHVQIYPPLFHAGLHVWLPVAGQNEVSMRFWAALCATLVVPAVYALGARLFNRQVGLLAGALAVVNPFLQWWGQDAHFYAYLVATTAVVNLAALRFWQPATLRNRHLAGRAGWYAALTLISFLTH